MHGLLDNLSKKVRVLEGFRFSGLRFLVVGFAPGAVSVSLKHR